MMKIPKIVIYELNEVPIKLIDLYIKRYPLSSFGELKKNGVLLETITKDNGELHPWSTWPTVHRGVYNDRHNIRFINQDLANSKKYKPIWEILIENNLTIGIFGSLQSYPPLIGKYVKFYLPDTFSPSSHAFPNELSLFQAFNLKLCTNNKAVNRAIKFRNYLDFTGLLFKGLLSFSVFYKTFVHILMEKINKKYKKRRSLIQNILTFSIFFKYLNRFTPDFSTYFTNHVAGMMHRYWKDLFPEDLGLTCDDIDSFKSKLIIDAMHQSNSDLEKLFNLSRNSGINILIASSMGQSAISRKRGETELMLVNFDILCEKLCLKKSNYKLLPAMQPDYCIESVNTDSMLKFRSSIKSLLYSNGENVFEEKYLPTNNRLNISLRRVNDLNNLISILYKNNKYPINELGFEAVKRDIGTAYHIPEGVLGVYGPISSSFEKYDGKKLETSKICPILLNLYHINPPDYINK